jgi:methionine biosynthesis protein MetW
MHLPAQHGGRLLDVGCGNGERLALLNSLGWQAQGVEMDEMAVGLARKSGLEVHLGSVQTQNYSKNTFDVITMNHVIEHLHDPISLLQECRRILKPRGLLVITTPNFSSWGHKVFKNCWRGLEPPRHLFLFNFINLPKILQFADFSIKSLVTTTTTADWIYLQSYIVRANNLHSITKVATVKRKLLAIVFSWFEQAYIKFNPHVGEELVLKAEK